MGRGDSLGEKIILALIAAAFGAVGTIVATRMTTKEPSLMVTVAAPQREYEKNKVVQYVTLKNTGEEVAKRVELNLTGCEGRLYPEDLVVVFTPFQPNSIEPQYSPNGDCALAIGDLQPSAFSTIKLSYKNPVFEEKDINTYSDNAKVQAIKFASADLIH